MNRLVPKWLWLKHAWFFNWAHKPLCEPYHEDVLRIGKLRLCRGCTMIKVGLAVALPLLLILQPTLPVLVAGFILGFAIAAALSHPALHSRWPRWGKDALRFLAGACAAHVLALFLLGHLAMGTLAASACVGAYWLYARLRLPRRLERCESCAELGEGICSGYARQAEAIRAWDEDCVSRLGPPLEGRG